MKYLALLVFIISVLFVGFVPGQKDFTLILTGYSAAFASYLLLIKKTSFTAKQLVLVAIALRVIFLFSFPNLSDDIYRFIWDGKLLHLGENPFAHLPSEYIKDSVPPFFKETFPFLNSPEYYSIYPPFAQFVFYLSTFSWMNSAFFFKFWLLIAECFTLYFGWKLLVVMKLPERNLLWYALNPLVLVEVMVNIHFEGIMVCFFVIFLFFLKVNLLNRAALFFSLSISAKLVPLIFLPFFICQWKLGKSVIFYLKIAAITLLLFLPILFQLSEFRESLDLYFRKFEFNASVYYFVRSLGYYWKGYNMIASIGPMLAIAVLLLIFVVAMRKRDFIEFSIWAFFLFLILSTTVHPWYAILGVALSVFSKRKFFIVWSFVMVFSYSKYGLGDDAYYWMVGLEYSVLALYLILETFLLKKPWQERLNPSS